MDVSTLLPTVQAYLQAGAPPDVPDWNPAHPFAVLPLAQGEYNLNYIKDYYCRKSVRGPG